MDCGQAPYCGLLVLESGFGSGKYSHDTPTVHGLWPETGNYGNSQCLNGDSYAEMPTHEWVAHGVCASNDPVTFFNTVCNLSSGPLETMSGYGSVGEMADALSQAGYPVYNARATQAQIEFSSQKHTNCGAIHNASTPVLPSSAIEEKHEQAWMRHSARKAVRVHLGEKRGFPQHCHRSCNLR
ncbi:hypothetical protein BC830DRAFT_1078359 [Chytriomyces sp. MP71]|nr:hypothetical protein BC830DRAFT_1078359 [Chytriomyces sp. MP71]